VGAFTRATKTSARGTAPERRLGAIANRWRDDPPPSNASHWYGAKPQGHVDENDTGARRLGQVACCQTSGGSHLPLYQGGRKR
jgi:hypothetical protein